MSLFSASHINVSYGKVQRLFDVSLPDLHDGDILGLLGPNAAGKSTLMRTLAGQQRATGDVWLAGETRQRIAHERWHASVGYMPQTPPQESSLRPLELLWSAARALGLPLSDKALGERIDTLLNRLGLQEFAVQPLDSLSGGKRQLVGLALALIREPRVLLLDEPTSALDLHWRMVVLDLVCGRVRREGGVVVAAIHDLDLAARYCTRLMMLEAGRVVAAGTVAEVLTEANMARVFRVESRIATGALGQPLVEILRPLINQ